jgi:hypothetical protein
MYAARIRPHFPPELRETAYTLALPIARAAGAKAKLLRPETTIDEVLVWVGPHYVRGRDSLDKVEMIMEMEADPGAAFVLPDELASRTNTLTFRQLVQFVAERR